MKLNKRKCVTLYLVPKTHGSIKIFRNKFCTRIDEEIDEETIPHSISELLIYHSDIDDISIINCYTDEEYIEELQDLILDCGPSVEESFKVLKYQKAINQLRGDK